MLDTLEAGLQKIQTPDDEVRGMLQIAVPSDLRRNLLLTLFRDFRQRHPALRLRLLFSDQLTDVFKDPVDVAFRYGNNDRCLVYLAAGGAGKSSGAGGLA